MPPIDFPFIRLNLSDVLYNPETKEIYTPNTDAVVDLKGSGRKLSGDGTSPEKVSDNFEELRYNPYHKPTNGQFTSNPFTSGNFSSSAIRFSGGGASKGLTTGGKSSKIKMSKKEYVRVSHEIATNFPNLKADNKKRRFYNCNHCYTFTVNDFGDYTFLNKEKLD